MARPRALSIAPWCAGSWRRSPVFAISTSSLLCPSMGGVSARRRSSESARAPLARGPSPTAPTAYSSALATTSSVASEGRSPPASTPTREAARRRGPPYRCRREGFPGLPSASSRSRNARCAVASSSASERSCRYQPAGLPEPTTRERRRTWSRQPSPSGASVRAGRLPSSSSAARVRRSSGRRAPATDAAPLVVIPQCSSAQ
jgi:hypothetical protein